MIITKITDIDEQIKELKKENITSIDMKLENMDDTKLISDFTEALYRNNIKIASFIPVRKLNAQNPDNLYIPSCTMEYFLNGAYSDKNTI